MRFSLNKNYAEAKQYLIDEGVFTEEYQRCLNAGKVVSDANKRYLDSTYVPKPPAKRKDKRNGGKTGINRVRREHSKKDVVGVNNGLYRLLTKVIPRGEITNAVNKMVELLYLHLKKPKMGFKTFMDADWDLVQITREEYEQMVLLMREKKPVIKDNPFV